MTGLHDRVFYVAADVEELAGKIGGLKRVDFADAGHLVPVERPAGFTKALLEFAKGV
jgi:pimeloyl-ACP methyl ester carboxylesterase